MANTDPLDGSIAKAREKKGLYDYYDFERGLIHSPDYRDPTVILPTGLKEEALTMIAQCKTIETSVLVISIMFIDAGKIHVGVCWFNPVHRVEKDVRNVDLMDRRGG